MPAPIDLTGDRYGSLLVLRRAQAPRRWECLCDCGRSCVVHAGRLRVGEDDRKKIRACDACRSRRCVVCGAPFLKAGSTATCGAGRCRLENRRANIMKYRASEEVRDPGAHARRERDRIASLRADPDGSKNKRRLTKLRDAAAKQRSKRALGRLLQVSASLNSKIAGDDDG